LEVLDMIQLKLPSGFEKLLSQIAAAHECNCPFDELGNFNLCNFHAGVNA
jgi:hypothetical protein